VVAQAVAAAVRLPLQPHLPPEQAAARYRLSAATKQPTPQSPDAEERPGRPVREGAPAGQAGGGVPTAQQLAQSILDPNAVVSAVNRYVQLKMKDGKTISGKLLSVDTFAYQIFDSTEKLANVPKENVREATMASPMPSYRDKLSTQELSDVVSYLMSLKGQ
jgi:small nuclear ribonucleoprotein (snRNP)-like protein